MSEPGFIPPPLRFGPHVLPHAQRCRICDRRFAPDETPKEFVGMEMVGRKKTETDSPEMAIREVTVVEVLEWRCEDCFPIILTPAAERETKFSPLEREMVNEYGKTIRKWLWRMPRADRFD